MHPKLLSWAFARQQRHPPACPGDPERHGVARRPPRIPPLWLFTDQIRLPDPRAAVSRLPKGLAGVVFRHDNDPDRAALGRDLARICRARRLVLVVAGDARLAAGLRAGMHLRGGRWPGPLRPKGFTTSSAHSARDLRRAISADLVFLSPVFATPSHPGAPFLGALRWTALARRASIPAAALGGIDHRTIGRLPRRFCRAAGAIGALARDNARPAARSH